MNTLEVTTDTDLTQSEVELDFSKFHLRRIVKENHLQPIKKIQLLNDEKYGNLLLSIGVDQVNLYDIKHYGDNMDLMCHYQLEKDEDYGELTCGCFIPYRSDLLIGFAGKKGIIHILSLGYSMELFRLYGHEDEIIEIIPHPTNEDLILTLSKDLTLRLWNLIEKASVCIINTPATTMNFTSSATKILLGQTNSSIIYVKLPSMSYENGLKLTINKTKPLQQSEIEKGPIIQLEFIGDKLLSITKKGCIKLWDPKSGEIAWSIRVKEFFKGQEDDLSVKVGLSQNQKFFVVGLNSGNLNIYSMENGKLIHQLSHRRSLKPIHQVVVSNDLKNIVYISGDGLVWKYDQIDDKTLKAWRNWKLENGKLIE